METEGKEQGRKSVRIVPSADFLLEIVKTVNFMCTLPQLMLKNIYFKKGE